MASQASRAARAAAKSRTGRRVGRAGARVGTRVGRVGARTGTRAATKAGKSIGKTAYRAGKTEARLRGAGRSGGKRRSRLLKYGLFTLLGFGIGAVIGRLGSGDSGTTYSGTTGHHSPEAGSPAGQRGATWGTGTPTGSAGPEGRASGVAQATGPEREYSDPSAGPLAGEGSGPISDIGTEEQHVLEQRIKTRLGEDSRTSSMPKVNVEVNESTAELRGPAPSEEAKEAAEEVARSVDGVREVRNLLVVS